MKQRYRLPLQLEKNAHLDAGKQALSGTEENGNEEDNAQAISMPLGK